MSSATFTLGDVWWIERTDENGAQRYPVFIEVGSGSVRDTFRYVPERTCRIVDEYVDLAPTYIRKFGRCDQCGESIETNHKYCSNCGARVEEADEVAEHAQACGTCGSFRRCCECGSGWCMELMRPVRGDEAACEEHDPETDGRARA